MKGPILSLAALLAVACQPSATPAPVAPQAPVEPPSVETSADESAIVIGERKSMTSSIMGEERGYIVYTPPNYDETTASFPVIYLLDGDGHFHHATGIVAFLSGQNRMPPAIVVGIPNTVRSRDLTPSKSDRMPSGGADKFLSFIETELMPKIAADYRTTPLNVLIGHSFGGLFAVNALIKRPGLFDAHIAAAPSLQWDDQLMKRLIEPMLAKPMNGFLYYTLGTEGEAITKGNQDFAALLEKSAPETLSWTFDLLAKDDHGSVVHKTIYTGLEMYFSKWRAPDTADTAAALVAHYEAIAKHYKMAAKPPEATVNVLGYKHLLATPPNMAAAKELFELGVELYPDSANVYDSLGEAHERAGEMAEALANYEKAVARSKPGEGFHDTFVANRDRAAKAVSEAPTAK